MSVNPVNSYNPYWVGLTVALSQYPGIQWLARRVQGRKPTGREGVLESGLYLPGFAQAVTVEAS